MPHGASWNRACEFRENRWHGFHSIGGLRNSTLPVALPTARGKYPTARRRLLDDRLDASAVADRTNLFFGFGFFSSHCDATPAMDVHPLHFAAIAQPIVRSNLEWLG